MEGYPFGYDPIIKKFPIEEEKTSKDEIEKKKALESKESKGLQLEDIKNAKKEEYEKKNETKAKEEEEKFKEKEKVKEEKKEEFKEKEERKEEKVKEEKKQEQKEKRDLEKKVEEKAKEEKKHQEKKQEEKEKRDLEKKVEEKAKEEGKEKGEGEGGGKRPFPRYTPKEAQEKSNTQPYSPSIDNSEKCISAGEQIINNPPQISEKACEGGEPFWSSVLKGVFGPLYPGYWSSEKAARGETWNEFSNAWKSKDTSWGDNFYAITDSIFSYCDSISGFLGPLGTILDIVSYVRYIPIPPIPAIGSALKLVSEIASAIAFICEGIKFAIKALQLAVPAFYAYVLKDNEARKKLGERWKKDLIGLGTVAFSIALSKFSLSKGVKNFKTARASGMGRAKSIFQGAKGDWISPKAWYKEWCKSWGKLKPNQMKTFFKETLDDASKNFILRRNVSLSGKDFPLGYDKTKIETFLQQLSKMPKRIFTRIKRGLKQPGYWVTKNAAKIGSELAYNLLDLPYEKISSSITEGFESGATFLLNIPESKPVALQIEEGLNKSSEELKKRVEEPKTPLLKSEPIPPESTKVAPSHLKSLAKEKEALKIMGEELKAQKEGAIAGVEEANDLKKYSEEHQKKAEAGKKETESFKQGLLKDKLEVKKAQEKITEAKAKQKEGEKGFGKVKGEGEKGKGAVPSEKVNPDDVPLYKKPFMWVVNKFNDAKAKVTQAMTNIIMKAVMGAMGFSDIDKQISQGDRKSKEAENLLIDENATTEKSFSLSEREIKGGKEGQEKAQKLIDENKKVEAEATRGIEMQKQAEEKNIMETQKTKIEIEQYKKKYGPSFDTLNKLSDYAEKGDITPVEISIENEINAIRDALSNLIAQIEGFTSKFSSDVEIRIEELKSMLEEEDSKVGDEIEKTGEEMKTEVLSEEEKRKKDVLSLGQNAEGFSGKFATKDILEKLGEIYGKIIGEAKAFDYSKDSAYNELHKFFKSTYSEIININEEKRKNKQKESQLFMEQ